MLLWRGTGILSLLALALPALGETVTRVVPIVLDVAGSGGSHFTTELTLANRGTSAAQVQLTYTSASALGATGSGSASVAVPAGAELVLPDVIAFLRQKGLAIPSGPSEGGTLRADFGGLSSADAGFAVARTTTPSGAGRAGLAYPGGSLGAAQTGTSYLYGLRSTAADRTNLALANADTGGSVTLRVTLFSGVAGDGRSFTLTPDVVLPPGQWLQIGKVLDAAGFVNAYARVDLVSGSGPYVAYAVVNDNVTNDGSFVAAEPAGMPAETRLLPVLVESAAFRSELILTNPLAVPQTANLRYVESASPAGGAGGLVAISFAAGEQKIIPDVVDYLRTHGAAIGPRGASTYAGALGVTFRDGSTLSTGFAGARTAAPVNGTGPGEYGLFYSGVGAHFASASESWVYGLRQDGANRSNVGLANLGDGGDPVVLRADVYDGTTGRLAGSTSPVTLAPGGWTQLNAVLQPSGVTAGYVRVVKLSGYSRFVAYGVVNDGGAPGQGTSDGSYVVGQAGLLRITAGAPGTFATHSQMVGYGFAWGLSDGPFGGIPAGNGTYTFFGTGGANGGCAGSPNAREGVFAFTGTLTQMTGVPGCRELFGQGSGPSGWLFDRDYAGGGEVLRFPGAGPNAFLMPFHGEYHWQNTSNPPPYWCNIGGSSTSTVPCFYSGLGLALTTDGGSTFRVLGQVLQPSQPISVYQGGGKNMDVGYGSLVLADANGRHLPDPPPDPNAAWFYLFFGDALPTAPGVCATNTCLGVARAPYEAVVSAVVSGDAHRIATLFRKYDGSSPDPWTQPATSDTPDISGTSGRYAPLFVDGPAYEPQVLYDSAFDAYLAIYPAGGPTMRTSKDLLHWSPPIGPNFAEPGRMLVYPMLLGETGDPAVAGRSPRAFYSSFVQGAFPDYAQSVFESVPLTVTEIE